MNSAPPGWYPDTTGMPVVRWWDGRSWTPYTQPFHPQPPPPRRADYSARIYGLLVTIVVMAVVLYVIFQADHAMNG